jgi:hypothetical protein
LPKQEPIATVQRHPAPLRIRTTDLTSIIRRKVTDHDTIVNNIINYPPMCGIQTHKDEKEEGSPRVEMSDGREGEERESEGDAVTEKENCEVKGEEEQKPRREQREIAMWADVILRLAPCNREASFELCDYFMRGVALDSDLVSKMLGVSQPAAHRAMLSFRSAGLVGVAKIPNYAYGEGYQYLYYSQRKTIYGGGVLGYLRERIYEDLTGREVVVSLSPRDVLSADMIVQSSHPLIIHAASSSSRRGLRLSALKERIQKVTDEFTSRNGLHISSCRVETSRVIVVTLWRKVAEELNEARRQGKLRCLCVLPFAKKSVDTLADYVLNHITIGTLLGESEREGDQEEEANREKIEQDVKENKSRDPKNWKRLDWKRPESGDGLKISTIQERILSIVRELGGAEPRVVADMLRAPLWKISKAANLLKKKGLLRIAKNLPFISSLKKPNATYYLDAGRSTALHDTLMNMVWEQNIKLGGRSRDYSFHFNGKTSFTDGLLENTGGRFLLEVVTDAKGDCGRVTKQIEAYRSQIGYNGIRGVIVVIMGRSCTEKLRERTRGFDNGISVFALLSREDKLQFRTLLLYGNVTGYHRNPT